MWLAGGRGSGLASNKRRGLQQRHILSLCSGSRPHCFRQRRWPPVITSFLGSTHSGIYDSFQFEGNLGSMGEICVSACAAGRRLRLAPCAPAGGTGWCCRKTFARSFWHPMEEVSWRITIAICSGPLRFGGAAEFGAFQSMKAKLSGIEIDACDPNEVCTQRLPTCSEENPAMMPASWVVKISPVAKISNQSVF